jgi:Flp pilus assembly protein TadG
MKDLFMDYRIDSKKEGPPMFRRHLGQDKGQAFVELALVLPIFILLLVGVAEVGRLAYASIEVSNAARAGVAYAARSHTTAADNGLTGGIVQAAKLDAPDVKSLSATTTNACSCESSAGVMTAAPSCSPTDINTTAGSCPSPSRIVLYVQVTTTAQVDTVFHFPGIPSTVTLNGFANMRAEQ